MLLGSKEMLTRLPERATIVSAFARQPVTRGDVRARPGAIGRDSGAALLFDCDMALALSSAALAR